MLHSIDWPNGLIVVAAFAFGYFLGAIPFGVLLTRLGGAGDVRTIGSGNIGATNVLRTGRKGLAAATLLGDALKGTLATVTVAYFDGAYLPLVAGFGAFVGHLFPVWLRFKGGKGVATYLGILLALSWPGVLAFSLIWLAVAALTRYSSLAALLASATIPVVLWLDAQPAQALLFVLLTIMLWIRHRENIARLVNGTEGKIGSKATPGA